MVVEQSKPNFDSVWAILQENALAMKEFREAQKETERVMKESQKETDRQIKEFTEKVGGLSNKFGAVAEHLVAAGIVEKLNELGYEFDGVADRGFKIYDKNKNEKTEIDILLENGKYVIAVEVKADVREGDIDHHIKRLEILRKYRNKHNDSRKICGAIAGAIVTSDVRKLAIEKGLYVLEQSGDTMKIGNPEGFVAKEW